MGTITTVAALPRWRSHRRYSSRPCHNLGAAQGPGERSPRASRPSSLVCSLLVSRQHVDRTLGDRRNDVAARTIVPPHPSII